MIYIGRYIIMNCVRFMLPTAKFIKKILEYSQDISLNIELLKIVIEGSLDIIPKCIDMKYISRLRTTNVIAAKEQHAESVRNDIAKIIEGKNRKLSLDEFYMIYTILQMN